MRIESREGRSFADGLSLLSSFFLLYRTNWTSSGEGKKKRISFVSFRVDRVKVRQEFFFFKILRSPRPYMKTYASINIRNIIAYAILKSQNSDNNISSPFFCSYDGAYVMSYR
jgi:hypothetical protein